MTAATPVNFIPATRLANTARRGLRLGLSLGDQALVSAANFGTTVILGNFVSQGELGRYGIALAGLLLATEAHHALVTTPHQVLLARRGPLERASFNGSALVHSLSFGLVAGVIAAIVGLVIGSATILALAAVLWAVLARHFARIFCYTTGKPGHAFALDATAAMLQIGGLLAFWHYEMLSATTAFVAIGGGNLVALVAVLLAKRTSFRPNLSQAAADLKATWPLSRWVFLSGIVWTLGTHGYPWLLSGLRTDEEVGTWTACFGIAALANPILMGVQNLVGPAVANKAAEDDMPALRRFIGYASMVFAVAMIPYVAVATFGGEWFLTIYKEKYAGFGHIVGMLSLATLAHAFGFAASRGLFAIGRARHDFYANVLALVIMLGPGAWLISERGVAGAAAAMVFSLVTSNLYRVIAFMQLGEGEVRT